MSLLTLAIIAVLVLGAVAVVVVSLKAMVNARCPFCAESGSTGAPIPLIFRWWCLECGRVYDPKNPSDEQERYTSSWSDEELADLERGEQPDRRRSEDDGE